MLMLLNWPLDLGSYQLYTVQNLGLRLHVFAGTCYEVSVIMENCGIFRVLSRNAFLGGKMVRRKCILGRGLEPSPRKVLLCLYPSTSISQCLLAGKSFL